MCGIGGGYGIDADKMLAALGHRGPDARGVATIGLLTLCHTRLSILDLDPRSNQPFSRDGLTLVYNGELWNYEALRSEMEACDVEFETTGDTEVVAAALAHWGLTAIERFHGMFAMAFAWHGGSEHGRVYLARDRYGEVPLHYAYGFPGEFVFASEIKAIIGNRIDDPSLIHSVGPGEIVNMSIGHAPTITPYAVLVPRPITTTRDQAALALRGKVMRAVRERMISDVPICTLLSGGIDSAAIAFCLKQYHPDVVAYTAAYDAKSSDLKAAIATAAFLGIELREVTVPPPTADDLREIVRLIEMPYKAQVEIAWACLHLADAMQRDGFKVTFSGEGSDELWASYGFAYHGLKKQDWFSYRRDLFLSQSRKNFPRCNKVFMSRGVECRLPFLHVPLVEYALSLPRDVVQDGSDLKAVLREAFRDCLPDAVVDRPKVAFQDGLGLKRWIADAGVGSANQYRAAYAELYGDAS